MERPPDRAESLTGIWHGLYSYPMAVEPIYFVATLIHAGRMVSGSTHEAEIGEDGAPLTLYATIDGSKHGQDVAFVKTYDGSGGWSHQVDYSGVLNASGEEIEGRWTVGPSARGPGWSGRFLMIRSSGASETVARRAYEKA